MINNIRKIREANGMSRTDIENAIGLHSQTLYRLESRTDTIDALTLLKLAYALESSPTDLVSFADHVELDNASLNNLMGDYTKLGDYCLRTVPLLSIKQAMN